MVDSYGAISAYVSSTQKELNSSLTRAELEREVAIWKRLYENASEVINCLHDAAARARGQENEACAKIVERMAPRKVKMSAAIRERMKIAATSRGGAS